MLGLLRLRRRLPWVRFGVEKMSLSAAQLKYILVLGGMGADVRTADVAKILNVKRSSAFNMLVKLEEEEIVIKNENKTVSFTRKGRELSDRLLKRVKETSDKLTESFSLPPDKTEEFALMLISVADDIM